MPKDTKAKAWQEEIFGPVVSVLPFTDEADAIEKANEEILSGWEDLDELFFTNASEEDVVSLIVDYIKLNENQFGN